MTTSGAGATDAVLREPAALRASAPERGIMLKRQIRQALRNPTLMFGLIVIVLMLVMAVCAPILTAEDPIKLQLGSRLRAPSAAHWLGTDDLGRDIMARVIYGSRTSLWIGLVVVLVAGSLGFTLGATTGYLRGLFDDVVMRLIDIVLAFPPLILAMAIASFLGPDLNNTMLAIAIVHIPKYTRLARGEALALREALFVQAARSAGASGLRIVFRHIIPNSLSSMLVVATLDFGLVILTAASLGFLGLGAQPPTPEWGLMVADGRKFLIDSPWFSTFPGLAIMLVVIAANVVGDGLRDLLDPRLRS
jgi:peptide/nickel transport system permease protein